MDKLLAPYASQSVYGLATVKKLKVQLLKDDSKLIYGRGKHGSRRMSMVVAEE